MKPVLSDDDPLVIGAKMIPPVIGAKANDISFIKLEGDEIWDSICAEFSDRRWFTVEDATKVFKNKSWSKSQKAKAVSLVLRSAWQTRDEDEPCMERVGRRWRFR